MAFAHSLYSSQLLVDVAMGRVPADLVIQNGQWVCVQSGEVIPGTDVAIKQDRIAYVGPNASHTIDTQTQVIQAEGRYLSPGLLDAHMHVESGMLTVSEFVRAVIPHGTTGMFIDPHEIANVFGLPGVRLVVDEALLQPIHVWVEMPSCVPSAPGLETPGANIGPDEVAEAMGWKGIIGLGEMMNFPGVFSAEESVHAEMAATRQAGKVIGGHYASFDLGIPFHGYVAGGPEDDHEGTRLEDAVSRVRQGMKAMIRFGSAWHDVDDQVRALTELKLDPRHFILCTDDSHSGTLSADGHVNRAVKRAIRQGVPPIIAIQMATINTADHFGVAREVGMIAPGRFADILILEDLAQFEIDLVIAQGKLAARKGRLMLDLPAYTYPEWVTQSIHLARPLTAADFDLRIPPGWGDHNGKTVTANIIGVLENQAPTRHLRQEVTVTNGKVRVDQRRDIAKIALIERHKGTGRVQVGLVHGFGFDAPCAVGSTVAHDCHHMIVVGTDETQMVIAANELARMAGGQVVVREGEIVGAVDLPIAGIISNERAEIVTLKVSSVLAGFKACGCDLNNPNMQLSLLGLAVIPDLRLTDLGLVDVNGFKLIPVLEK